MIKHRAPAILNQTFIPCLKSVLNPGRLVGEDSVIELFLIGNLSHPSSVEPHLPSPSVPQLFVQFWRPAHVFSGRLVAFSFLCSPKSFITHLPFSLVSKIVLTFLLLSLLWLSLSLCDCDFHLFFYLFTVTWVRFLKTAWENARVQSAPLHRRPWKEEEISLHSSPFPLPSSPFISVSLMPRKVPTKFSTTCQFTSTNALLDISSKN